MKRATITMVVVSRMATTMSRNEDVEAFSIRILSKQFNLVPNNFAQLFSVRSRAIRLDYSFGGGPGALVSIDWPERGLCWFRSARRSHNTID